MYTQDIYYGQGQLYLQIHIPLFPTNDVSPTNIQIVELPHETDSSIMPNTAHVQKKKKNALRCKFTAFRSQIPVTKFNCKCKYKKIHPRKACKSGL